jgi:hypothetical protein
MADGLSLLVWKIMADPSWDVGWVGADRFSTDSKKLAVKLDARNCLEVSVRDI